MEISTAPEYRLVQVFLARETPSTFEVYVNLMSEVPYFCCTCPGFSIRRKCKHVAHVVADRGEEGLASIAVDDNISLQGFAEALQDPTTFRSWVLSHGKVAVL